MSDELELELMDCPLCGLPMETKSEWTQYLFYDQVREVTEMVTCACMRGHWYGGPRGDLERGREAT